MMTTTIDTLTRSCTGAPNGSQLVKINTSLFLLFGTSMYSTGLVHYSLHDRYILFDRTSCISQITPYLLSFCFADVFTLWMGKKQNWGSHPADRGTKDLDKLAQWLCDLSAHDQTCRQTVIQNSSTPSGGPWRWFSHDLFYILLMLYFSLLFGRFLVAFVCQFLSCTKKKHLDQWTQMIVN